MQGGVIGGICLLAFLLSKGRAEELETPRESKGLTDIEDAKQTPGDLKSGVNLGITESDPPDNEGRSGARSLGGSASKTPAQSNDGGPLLAYSDSYGGFTQAKAAGVSGGAQTASFNPFNEELGPYIPPGSSLPQAKASSDSGNSYNQELNSYPYSSSYPYSPGLNSIQAQAEANNRIYQPGYNGSPNLGLYNQGSSLPQMPGQGDRESFQPIIETFSVKSKPVSKVSPGSDLSYLSSSYPYTPGLSSGQKDNSASYQAVPIPDSSFSTYDRLMVPYEETRPQRPIQGQNSEHSLDHPHEKGPYQAIPLPDHNPAPYDFALVPYKDPSFLVAKIDNDETRYKPSTIPKVSPKQDKSITRQHNENSDTASIVSSPLSHGLKSNPIQEEIDPNLSIPIPDHDPSTSITSLRESSSENKKEAEENDERQFVPSPYEMKSDPLSLSYPNLGRSNENTAFDELDLNPDLESKSGWNVYKYHRYPPRLTYSQLYPSGAEAAQAYAAVRPASSGVSYLYTPGISSYPIDYPSESPYRPKDFNEPLANGQSSPIAFEDAKSREILPHEYVFPNKMRGGENVIQCTKENEFHHFWSKGLDCLVCICLNEYGLLTPVCASCGGCHNPPPTLPEPIPQLPENIPVQPATPEPFEPFPINPEPQPVEPEPEPVPTPAPYPMYPEPIPSPSPGPELIPEPIATLTTPSPAASCAPLPSGEPFTNPLHPCQICVCRESSVSGKPDVQIECKENPQCIAPADVTTLPPIPDVPMPIPLPICEKFPENVLFPHPTETCKLCKCAKSLSENGLPEQQITCYPHPDCVPKLEPVTEPAPPLPIPVEPQQVQVVPEPGPEPVEPVKEPFSPMEPVPLPEIVTVEPLPWPPITTIAPVPTPGPTLPAMTPRPGPLPGPSPHESCRPYPPNQTFQHPWDECQICLCTEAIAVGVINVEVNCYTKPSCCIEPPEAVKSALPGFNLPYPGLSNAAKNPEFQALSPGSQTNVITSTYRPPSTYISYTPRPVSIYPASSKAVAVDALTPPKGYPSPSYPRMQTDAGYGDPSSSYPYQPNYHPTPYVNPQYPDYPPRLPPPANTIGSYKATNYAYPGNYQYAQGDAVGNNYPPPQGHFNYDPRFQVVPTSNAYPPIYPRAGYDIPPIYPGQGVDGYAQAQGGSKPPNLPQAYAATVGRSKSGNDGPEDQDDA